MDILDGTVAPPQFDTAQKFVAAAALPKIHIFPSHRWQAVTLELHPQQLPAVGIKTIFKDRII